MKLFSYVSRPSRSTTILNRCLASRRSWHGPRSRHIRLFVVCRGYPVPKQHSDDCDRHENVGFRSSLAQKRVVRHIWTWWGRQHPLLTFCRLRLSPLPYVQGRPVRSAVYRTWVAWRQFNLLVCYLYRFQMAISRTGVLSPHLPL